MSAITDEDVAAKARELHDGTACTGTDCLTGSAAWIYDLARSILKGERARADADRDRTRVRAEVRDRLDAAGDVAELAALRWLAHEQPDLVNAALDAVGVPS